MFLTCLAMLKSVVVYLLSHVRIFCNPWTVAHQAPLSMGFPRQEYWSGLLFPSLGGSSPPRNQTSIFCVAGRFCITKPPVKSNIEILSSYKYIGFFLFVCFRWKRPWKLSKMLQMSKTLQIALKNLEKRW